MSAAAPPIMKFLESRLYNILLLIPCSLCYFVDINNSISDFFAFKFIFFFFSFVRVCFALISFFCIPVLSTNPSICQNLKKNIRNSLSLWETNLMYSFLQTLKMIWETENSNLLKLNDFIFLACLTQQEREAYTIKWVLSIIQFEPDF